MTDQDQINALNQTEAERVRWMTVAINAWSEINALKDENLCLEDEISILKLQLKNRLDENVYLVEQTDALKAQVNCLREVLKILDRNSKAREALEATPEQCLAEVKAKAIEDSMPKIINACVKYSVEKYINTSVEMVSVGQLKHLSEIRHHGEWEQAK